MDPPLDHLPKKRQAQLKSLGGNTFKFEPESQPNPKNPRNQFTPSVSSNANRSGISKSDPVTLSFESIKLPDSSKNQVLSQINSAEFDLEGNEREFAGEDESKLYSIHDIYKLKKGRMYSNKYKDVDGANNQSFKKVSDHYIISKERVSPITQSHFCYLRKNYPERAVPYKDELDKILKTIHLKRGNHLNMNKCVDRANELKVYWPGYLKDIKHYLSSCSCMQVSKLWCN